jgi:glycosyltransferase involved in cell wall biosynthesis
MGSTLIAEDPHRDPRGAPGDIVGALPGARPGSRESPEAARSPKRSVAILVDDVAGWFQAGFQPTGIQRVVMELLDTASARPDVEAWPAVAVEVGQGVGPRLDEIPRDFLQHSHLEVGDSRVIVPDERPVRLRLLRAARALVVRVPLPKWLRRRAKSLYLRLVGPAGPVAVTAPDRPDRRPDLVLAPGAFWYGDLPAQMERLARQGLPVRIIIYDLFPITNPEWCDARLCRDFAASLETVVPICDRVVTLSEPIARDVVRAFPELSGRIRVAAPHLIAHAPRSQAAPRRPPTDQSLGQFIFTLGTAEPRKNHRVLIDAWRIVCRSGKHPRASLVIAGRYGWMSDDLEAEIERFASELRIVRLKSASDGEVEWLYARCSATVHPSWAEGLGLPPRESIARGIPTLVSSAIPTDGLPDGLHDGLCERFDPRDVDRLVDLISRALAAGPVRYPVAQGDGTGWEHVLDALLDEA